MVLRVERQRNKCRTSNPTSQQLYSDATRTSNPMNDGGHKKQRNAIATAILSQETRRQPRGHEVPRKLASGQTPGTAA